ncbi:MAG: class I SAM-dependent methyltransferase [Defluviitaleaceae bacterium]|nr:class I SAM-dependent methyltransferase [Defluviitaleaceae bacterium]
MSFNKFISKQLSAPTGISGRIIGYFMNRQNIPLYQATIKHLQLSGGETILDIGCGSGYVLNMIAQQQSGIFTGIDLSQSMINTATRRYKKHSNMTFHRQDLAAMAFPAGAFSHAYTINTVYFWGSPAATMQEIYRVLQPGGIFVNCFYSDKTLDRFAFTKHGYRRFPQAELSAAGESAGFSLEILPILGGDALCYRYRKQGR